MPRVSRFFFNVFYDSVARLELRRHHCSDVIKAVLSRATNAKTITIAQISGSALAEIASSMRVQSLKMCCTGLGDKELAALASVPSLTYLHLTSYSAASDEGFAFIKRLKKLRKFEITTSHPSVGNSFLRYFVDLPELTVLNLEAIAHFQSKGMRNIARMKQLRELGIHCSNVTDDGLDKLLPLQQLQTLILHNGANISDIGLETLARLKALQSLEITGLSDTCSVTHAGIAALQQAPSLTHLGFDAKVDQEKLEQIAQLKGLTSLRLYSFEFNDRSCLALLSKLHSLSSLTFKPITNDDLHYITLIPALTTLNLVHSRAITDEGIAFLESMSRLAELNVSNDSNCALGITTLHERLPHLKITHYVCGICGEV